MRVKANILALALGSIFMSSAMSAPTLTHVDRKAALLAAPKTTVLYLGAMDLLTGCKLIGIGPFKRCSAPESVSFSAGVPPGGLDALHVTSNGTTVYVEATIEGPGMGATVLVNSNRCPLVNGGITCDVPVSSGTNLEITVFPSASGEVRLREETKLQIKTVELRRGYESVLKSIRDDAFAAADAIDRDKPLYEKLQGLLRYLKASKADLKRWFDGYTVNWIDPLPKYNTPILDAAGNKQYDEDGFLVRNRLCPIKVPEKDGVPEHWSHTAEQCAVLGTITDILNGEAKFDQAGYDEVAARLQDQGSVLARIVAVLEANQAGINARFQALLKELREKGIISP